MHGKASEAWAERAACGDRAALGRLFDALSPDLYGYLADLTADAPLAEDLLQQLWLKAMHALAKRRAPVRPWLFVMARHLALDALRRRARQRTVPLSRGHRFPGGADAELVTTDELKGLDGPDEVDQAAQLRRAMGSLPVEQRDVILLRFYSGMRLREIAQILGLPVPTVATRLRRGLLRLRQELACEYTA